MRLRPLRKEKGVSNGTAQRRLGCGTALPTATAYDDLARSN
jgi:hypothetical protein